MNDAMFGLFQLGGAEIILILFTLMLVAAGIVGLVLLVVWAVNRGSRRAPTAPPTQPNEPPRPVLPRNCPRCGTRLPPDAPEGLCPRCVLAVGLATQTEAEGESGPHGARVTEPPPAASDIAKHFPHLEIIECLGRGGMGVVYKARQPKLNRVVALKILAPEKGADPRFAERFLREAQALARLSHPNIVTVHDFGEVDGLYYLLMEYVDGMTLRQLLQGEKLAPEQALSIVPRICDALQFAHEQGVVHRDIKPENVLLDRQGRVKIADFGIAKILAVGQAPQALTQDQVVGTPHYMAPEQVEKPQLVDHRADIYSLGVVFYEMLTGELPLGKFQPPSKKVQVDVRLDQVVLHALEKEPERRYQHASDVKCDVETIATTPAAAPASAKAESPGIQPERTQQRATCYFSTPERMRNCFPNAAAQIFICKGELRLEAETLTFVTPWQTRLVIPLKDIEDLSIGQFQMWTTPWIMQYARMNFLALTYAKDGTRETVHLAPVPPGAASAGQVSGHVTEWFEAIQKRVGALKGSVPGTTDSRAVTISAEPAWNKKGIPLFVALLATAGLVAWRAKSGLFGPSPEPLWVMVFIGLWLLLLGVIAFSVGFLKANSAIARGNLDAVTSDEPPEGLRPPEGGRGGGFTWLKAARWSARVLGTLLLCFYGLFVFGEGLPPIGSQPEGVQLSFAAVALMLLGFIVGWKREGTAALLIGSGWTLWHIAEGGFALNAFQTPLPVAVLYGFCWWETHGRRTRVVLWAVVMLTIILVAGRLFCPSSVFVRGVIIDAETDKPIAGAELTLEGRSTEREKQESHPNARSGKDGRFSLYVGWYAERKKLVITAQDYATLTTTLGPRALGQRNVGRVYELQPTFAVKPAQEILRVRLQQAEAEAERMKQLAEVGRVSAAEVEAAQDKVEVLKAELANDPVRVAQVRLAGAERQLKRAAELWKLGRISSAEYEAAKADVAVRKAELQAASATPGPVIERVLHDPDDRPGNNVLTLASGVLSSELTGAEKLSGGRIRRLLASPADLYAEYDDYVGGRWALITAGLELSDLAPRQLETATASEVTSALQRPTVVPHVAHDGATLYLLPDGLSPMTFAFRTREGRCGLLQITGFTDNPRAVKIRYKL